MAIYLMDKAYRIFNAGGVARGRVVVATSGSGGCTLPAAANAGKILGVTVTSQEKNEHHVSVRKAGIVEVVSAGVIGRGDPVNIADNQGRVKVVNETAGSKVQCLGFAETASTNAGDLVEVFISVHERTT